jgi:hypothetical protein
VDFVLSNHPNGIADHDKVLKHISICMTNINKVVATLLKENKKSIFALDNVCDFKVSKTEVTLGDTQPI